MHSVSVRGLDGPGPYDEHTLSESLTKLVIFDATYSRDRVYGLVGLLNPKTCTIRPDYSLSLNDVLKHTAIAIMKSESTVRYLVDFASQLQNPSQLPLLSSWAVDFAHFGPRYFYSSEAHRFGACDRHTDSKLSCCDELTVTYSGLLLDSVTHVGAVYPDSGIYKAVNSVALLGLLLTIWLSSKTWLLCTPAHWSASNPTCQELQIVAAAHNKRDLSRTGLNAAPLCPLSQKRCRIPRLASRTAHTWAPSHRRLQPLNHCIAPWRSVSSTWHTAIWRIAVLSRSTVRSGQECGAQ